MNPVFRSQVKPGGIVPEAMSAEDFEMRQMAEEVLQAYFNEAKRTVDVKIFKVQIKHANRQEPVTKYFVNRIEIGHTLQTPQRITQVHNFLEQPGEIRNREELKDQKLKGLQSQISEQHAFEISVECRLRDKLGNTYDSTQGTI